MVTYFVVQGFQAGKGGILVADEPRQIHGDERRCIRYAQRLADERAGVIAFSRSGDPNTGDWEDAKVLWQVGLLPDETLAMTG